MSARVGTTTGSGFLAFDPGLDDIGGATDSGSDLDGAGRTILSACAAFHTPIAINDFCFFSVYFKYGMGADTFTHATADTSFGIKLQRRDPFQISKIFHFWPFFTFQLIIALPLPTQNPQARYAIRDDSLTGPKMQIIAHQYRVIYLTNAAPTHATRAIRTAPA